MEFSHIPVLLQPCLDGLNIDPTGIYLDGTAGGAGHSREIAKRLTTGRLISLLASRRSTGPCSISACPATSWTTRPAASLTMPTRRSICA